MEKKTSQLLLGDHPTDQGIPLNPLPQLPLSKLHYSTRAVPHHLLRKGWTWEKTSFMIFVDVIHPSMSLKHSLRRYGIDATALLGKMKWDVLHSTLPLHVGLLLML
jgi:hypothetical protein